MHKIHGIHRQGESGAGSSSGAWRKAGEWGKRIIDSKDERSTRPARVYYRNGKSSSRGNVTDRNSRAELSAADKSRASTGTVDLDYRPTNKIRAIHCQGESWTAGKGCTWRNAGERGNRIIDDQRKRGRSATARCGVYYCTGESSSGGNVTGGGCRARVGAPHKDARRGSRVCAAA